MARENLINEGYDSSKIFVTGNTIIDSLLETKRIIESDSSIQKSLGAIFGF